MNKKLAREVFLLAADTLQEQADAPWPCICGCCFHIEKAAFACKAITEHVVGYADEFNRLFASYFEPLPQDGVDLAWWWWPDGDYDARLLALAFMLEIVKDAE